jgi:mono/diheme cytochrome c family protein
MKLLRIALSLALLAWAPTFGQAESKKEQQAHGAAVFDDAGCRQCHGIGGTGGKKGPDLSGIGRRLQPDQIRKQIVEGGKQMPPFGEALQSSEVDDLIVYLRSLRDKKANK